MLITQTPHCCTARLISRFNTFDIPNDKKTLTQTIKNAKRENQKILYCFLTDRQKNSIKLVKEHGFKRAGRKNTRPDNHYTKLYLYYLILE